MSLDYGAFTGYGEEIPFPEQEPWSPIDGNGDGAHETLRGRANLGVAEDVSEGLIQNRLTWLRANAEAKRRLDEEKRPVTLPAVRSLDRLLAEPDTAARFRIAELAPIDSRIILSAQYKTGKTIIVDNVVRSLADGDPFLGRFAVNTPASRIVLIDDELSENLLRHWLRDGRVHPPV